MEAKACAGNPYDGHILAATPDQATSVSAVELKKIYVTYFSGAALFSRVPAGNDSRNDLSRKGQAWVGPSQRQGVAA